jgi:hypothetical protein
MTVFFQELSKRLAEKWLTLLVLPGLLLVAAAGSAVWLGHRHWADFRGLVTQLGRLANDLEKSGPVAIGLVVVAATLAATVAGLAATAVGRLVRLCWIGRWPSWLSWLARRLTSARNRRWHLAHDELDAELDRGRRDGHQNQAKLDRLAARCNGIALAEPSRPTWIGDRVAAVDARVSAEYELDLASAWPRLWLLVPDSVRAELQAAATGFDKAATLAGWAVLYVLVGCMWWPAGVAGLVTAAVAWHRGRVTMSALADLAEATVDLYGTHLAKALGLACDDVLTEPVGRRVTSLLRKGS